MISVSQLQHPGPTPEPRRPQRPAGAGANPAGPAPSHSSSHSGLELGNVLPLYQAAVQHPVPADLAAVPAPRVGYTGCLVGGRLDVALLLCLARKRPDYHLVLVGPEDEDFRRSDLHQLPNVHFLGHKPPEQLPAYVQHFDVCINPQLLSEAVPDPDQDPDPDPLKIDEYLAMGRPVVATRTRTMALFADYAYLAANRYEWLAQLAQVLVFPDAGRAARSEAFAQSHTWPSGVARCYHALQAARAPQAAAD